MEAEREPGGATREEVATCLLDVERSPLDEDVRGDRDARRVREHLGDQPVDVGIRVGMLGRDSVRAEPGRDAPGGPNRLELRELRVVVEAVPALALEGGGPVGQHRVSMTRDDRLEGVEAGGPRRTGRRQDPAARGEELLVRRTGAPQRELVRAVAGERRVRVAVDEPGDRREPSTVDLLDVAVEPRQVAHAADLLEETVTHQDVRVLDDVDLGRARRREAVRRHPTASRAGRGLERGGGSRLDHDVTPGRSSPPARAASTASS